MKGNSSENYIFKNLPRIILSTFQGSMGSTSQGVKNVFRKARSILKTIKQNENSTENQKIISMIYFDEMGLAEHSPNNPLKVIHSELEYDLNEGDKKIAFVGISNWALDASKMNRGLYLSIPDPDEIDVKKTARTIGKSYSPELAKIYRNLYENLGLLYYKYKEYLRSTHNNWIEEFHGNRDFYHLVKNVAKNIVKGNSKSLDENIRNAFVTEAIERNFAGLIFDNTKESSLKRIKKYYREFDPNVEIEDKYDVIKRISENIVDFKSRYLLVISKPSISEFLLSSILNEKNKEYNYYKGSPFEDDLKSEEYILKILNKVQLHMEQDKVLILNNLGTVYPGLYDLFNQNFTEVSKKNYARIAMGYTTNAFSFVNDKFRCIVNVEEDKINKEESPFLNRFEKQIISFENLLGTKDIEKSREIYEKLLELTNNGEGKRLFEGINYNLKDLFINLDKEEIDGYIYKIKKEGTKIQDYAEKVIKKISLLLPQDIIIFLKYSGYISKYKEYYDKILDGYIKGEHTNLSLFLQKMNDKKNVIYTFSPIHIKIENIDEFKNDNFEGKIIKANNIFDIEIGAFTSENKFEEKIDEFFNTEDKKICLIKFNSDERHFLNYVKFFIENKEKENKLHTSDDKKIKKAFVFIVYLDRNFEEPNSQSDNITVEKEERNKFNETISLTSEYYQIFIDNLNGKREYTINDILTLNGGELTSEYYQIFIDNLNGKREYTINDILTLNGGELFEKFNFEERLNKDIYETFSYMEYNIPYSFNNIKKDNYVTKLSNLIQNDFVLKEDNKVVFSLKKKINEILIQQMEKDKNIIINALNTKNLIEFHDIDMISSIQRYLTRIYISLLNNFYYKAEKDQFFSTLLSINKIKEDNKGEMNEIKDEEDENKEKNNEYGKDNVNKQKIIENTIKIYLDNFNFEDEEEISKKNNKIFNIIEDFGANKIDIILGSQLPGVYPIISYIIKKSRTEVIKKYASNESKLRRYIKDYNVENEVTIYNNKLKFLTDQLFIDLDKNKKNLYIII